MRRTTITLPQEMVDELVEATGSGSKTRAVTLAVEEELCGVARGEDVHGRDLADAFRPVPVRQDMGHGQLRAPVRLVEVEAVLFKAGQINDAAV